ncbi:MAG: hypothetical protein ACO2PN_20745 [Pyrobaculum sp.]
MTPQDAGMLLTLQALAMAISAPLAGRLSDKTSPSAVSTGGRRHPRRVALRVFTLGAL